MRCQKVRPIIPADAGIKPAKNMGLLRDRRGHDRLPVSVIEKTFVQKVFDLKRIVVLDDVDIDGTGFSIRCHDLHGPLPEIAIENSGDRFRDKDRLGNEVCKMIAIVRLRDEMVRFLPGSTLLPPTSMDGKAIVGLQAKPRTWIAEGESYLAAYHELHGQIVG